MTPEIQAWLTKRARRLQVRSLRNGAQALFRASCRHKVRHACEEDTWSAVAYHADRFRQVVQPYRCSFCFGWHVGRVPSPERQARRLECRKRTLVFRLASLLTQVIEEKR